MKQLIETMLLEKNIIDEMVRVAELQKRTLIEYDIKGLEEILSYQEQLAARIRKIELDRLRIIAKMKNITQNQAAKIKLSDLASDYSPEIEKKFLKLKTMIESSINRLQSVNSTNRMLSNRAKIGVSKMLSLFSNGKNYVCNVQV